MARAARQKINGVIDKRDLAEIFRRAEGIMRTRAAAPGGERRPGRLGKALIKELLTRAVMVGDRPAVARAAAQAKPKPPRPKAPSARKQPAPKPPTPKPPTPELPTPELPTPELPTPELPTPKAQKARELLHRIDDLATKPPPEAAPPQSDQEPLSLLQFLEEQDAKDAAAPDMFGAATDVLEAVPEVPDNVVEPPSKDDSRVAAGDEPLSSESDTFLSLSELTASLSRATKGHLDDQAAARTMIDDLEMPEAMDDSETQEVLARVALVEEISFEGYLEDIEELLLETYEHYKSLPQALDVRPVDPAAPDLLGPSGKTLETRRADRKASRTLPAPANPAASASRGHLVPSTPIHAPQNPIVPQRPGAQAPHSWQPDPFTVDPFSGAQPSVAAGPDNPFAQAPGAPAAGGSVDPFSLNPYTGQSMAGQDPFKLDPFNPFGGPPAGAPGYGGPPAAGPPPAAYPGFGPAMPPPPGPGAHDPFMNPYGQAGAFSPGPAPGPPPAVPQAFAPGPAAAPPRPSAQAPLTPPKDPFASTPASIGPGTPKTKANETLGFDPFADPGESQDPYSWPSRPPQALADAQAKADEVAAQFDPFGPNSSAVPGMGGPSPALSAGNPFGPGNMFGAPRPPAVGPGTEPIYSADSDEFSKPSGFLSAVDSKRAFENALVVAGLRGMLEYQRPAPGHGSSHPLMVIYDTTTGLFKAPLTPRMSVGDRFQLKDGQIFRVDRCRVHAVGNTPCYQEAECKPLGKLNMPLRDSWDEPNPPR